MTPIFKESTVSQDARLMQIWWFQPNSVTSYRLNKTNFLEFWVKMPFKVNVNDPHFQHQLRVSHDAYLLQIWWFQLKSTH